MKPLTPADIIQIVAQATGVDHSELASGTRHRAASCARAVYSFMCRRYTTASYPEIAAAMAIRTHSTVVTADQSVGAALEGRVITANGPMILETLARCERELVEMYAGKP